MARNLHYIFLKPEMVATPTKAHLKDVKEIHIRHYLF